MLAYTAEESELLALRRMMRPCRSDGRAIPPAVLSKSVL